jgi:hypothetical protein
MRLTASATITYIAHRSRISRFCRRSDGMSEEVTAQGRDLVAAGSPPLPPCCNSGCTVCVLDYPELFISDDAGMLALLEAVEQAERTLAGRAGVTDANHYQGE